MSSGFWFSMAVKAVSTGAIVTLASGVAEIAGPVWGALAASLPVSAGPTYVFLALEHDRSFVAASALGSCVATAATMAFLTIYARLGAGNSQLRALGAAVATWLVLALLIQAIVWSVATAVMLNLAAFAGCLRLVRRVDTGAQVGAAGARRWYDFPVRAVAVGLFVPAIVVTSAAAGPAATGVAAMFPIVFSSLILVLHGRIGGLACAALAATGLRAMGGFSLMLLVLHLAVVPLGPAIAMLLALMTTLAWSGGMLLRRRQAYLRPAG